MKLIILFFIELLITQLLDEIKEYEISIDIPDHKSLLIKVHFHDPSSFILVQRIMKDCSTEEKDALISIANKEQPEEFAARYNFNYANAVQKRRRIIQKLKIICKECGEN